MEKYNISGIKVVILKLLKNLKVKTTNVTEILKAMSELVKQIINHKIRIFV